MLRYLLISALMLRYMLVPGLLAASSPSDADTCICNHASPTPVTKACKLVVRDFDGPAKLAWINDEGSRHTLTISVREATTGSEIDTVSVRVNDKGVAADPASLMSRVDDLLEWAECKPQITGH